MGTRTITLVLGEDGNPIGHPTIYDMVCDKHRPVTQDDVDDLLKIKVAFLNVVEVVRKSGARNG